MNQSDRIIVENRPSGRPIKPLNGVNGGPVTFNFRRDARKLFREAKIPMTLTELGIGEEHVAEMAAHANPDGYLKNAFVPLTNEDIEEIYRACL